MYHCGINLKFYLKCRPADILRCGGLPPLFGLHPFLPTAGSAKREQAHALQSAGIPAGVRTSKKPALHGHLQAIIRFNMIRLSSRLTGVLLALAVALVLVAELSSHHWLVYIFKPLATLLLLHFSLSSWSRTYSSFSFWITFGLFFSLIGDVALIWPSRYFLPGLLAFLFTHAAYLVAFLSDTKLLARPFVWLIYLAIAAAIYVLLFPNLPGSLRIPVAAYSVLLLSMAAQAATRALILKTRAARLAAIGAGFFMLSDVLLSFDRFHTALLLAPVLVLVPYYVGQWLIASSTVDV
jgi:uncharacterized membrane protein YhhN